jgi:hypothetical protein
VDEPANLPVVVVVVIDDVVDVAIVVLSLLTLILKLIAKVITTISITRIIVDIPTTINILLWFLDNLCGNSLSFLGSDFALVLCLLKNIKKHLQVKNIIISTPVIKLNPVYRHNVPPMFAEIF